jgi:hypothetical protein
MYMSMILILTVTVILALVLLRMNNNVQQSRVPIYIRSNERRQTKRQLPPTW